jgi:hypothetical protein
VDAGGNRLAKTAGGATLEDLQEYGVDAAAALRKICASLGWPECDSAPQVLEMIQGRPALLEAPEIFKPWVYEAG